MISFSASSLQLLRDVPQTTTFYFYLMSIPPSELSLASTASLATAFGKSSATIKNYRNLLIDRTLLFNEPGFRVRPVAGPRATIDPRWISTSVSGRIFYSWLHLYLSPDPPSVDLLVRTTGFSSTVCKRHLAQLSSLGYISGGRVAPQPPSPTAPHFAAPRRFQGPGWYAATSLLSSSGYLLEPPAGYHYYYGPSGTVLTTSGFLPPSSFTSTLGVLLFKEPPRDSQLPLEVAPFTGQLLSSTVSPSTCFYLADRNLPTKKEGG